MKEEAQLKLALIERNGDNDIPVQQRLMDGYINATNYVKQAGKTSMITLDLNQPMNL